MKTEKEGEMKKISVVIILTFILTINLNAMTYEEINAAYHKSFLYEKNGDYANAIRAIMPVYKNYPKGYTVNLRLGWLYYLLGNYSNAKTHYKKAMEIIPTSVEAMLGYSLPLMAQQKWKDVAQLMYKLLKIDYYNFYGNLRLSVALRNLGKFKEAEQIDRKMLALYPSNVSFLLELGISLYYQGKKTYAKSIFKDVITLDPENNTAKEFLKKMRK